MTDIFKKTLQIKYDYLASNYNLDCDLRQGCRHVSLSGIDIPLMIQMIFVVFDSSKVMNHL